MNASANCQLGEPSDLPNPAGGGVAGIACACGWSMVAPYVRETGRPVAARLVRAHGERHLRGEE
ncbi:hypothetical protein ACIBH1_45380 [Nonomuraea sp. NPDC050663]|uniref:hypothetical protein n=1 Tax=Nonomuraea sp. NPDC050663 TaxID=3364370 RepID=UPI0037BCD024